jgi:hypothetical protein
MEKGHPDIMGLLDNRAIAHHRNGQKKAAIADAQKMIKTDSTSVKVSECLKGKYLTG